MGPISNIDPKISRAARDRPEQNPRRNQPSRHLWSFAGATAPHEKSRRQRKTPRQARRTAARNVARLERRPVAAHGDAHRLPEIFQWRNIGSATVQHRRANMHEPAHRHSATIAQGCWIVARPTVEIQARCGTTSHDTRRYSIGHHALDRASGRAPCAASAKASRALI
ncbi:hypothetical protein F511_09292 [Dorcoceras hygrometricum]|uniref:Uncharacterized protein n=1 Tax=Dorcoceras hygrometricum TaxID=472368 RepID=A0A2Z7AI72_9LAMI|nr:hypothetical protein F511_09292 [Dorcoceras hygrometricum]